MTNIFAKELRGGGISGNTVASGPIATARFYNGKTPEQIAHLSKLAPLDGSGDRKTSPTSAPPSRARTASGSGQTIRINGGVV